jgi:C1A family cysteine protease
MNTVKSDSGAQIRDCVKVLASTGAAPESLWPYDVTKFTKKPPASFYKVATKHQALRYERVDQTPDAMEQVLAKGYPIIMGFTVYESFESAKVAKTGMVPMPAKGERSMGGHAILVVGYDRKRRLFIVRNSWGSGWGDKGYFYVGYDYFCNPSLADDLWVIYTVEDEDAGKPGSV